MGELPQEALNKFNDANQHFKLATATEGAFTIKVPQDLNLKDIKYEIMILEKRLQEIAAGLMDFKDATLLSLQEVKRELK